MNYYSERERKKKREREVEGEQRKKNRFYLAEVPFNDS